MNENPRKYSYPLSIVPESRPLHNPLVRLQTRPRCYPSPLALCVGLIQLSVLAMTPEPLASCMVFQEATRPKVEFSWTENGEAAPLQR